jgi:hypothetical protein
MNTPAPTPWVILSCRYGADIRQPSGEDLASALADVFHENLPSMTEGDYAAHPCASIRYGFDAGPMHVLEVRRGGRVQFSQWADQDYETELEPEMAIDGVGENEALRLWKLLAGGQIDAVKTACFQRHPS